MLKSPAERILKITKILFPSVVSKSNRSLQRDCRSKLKSRESHNRSYRSWRFYCLNQRSWNSLENSQRCFGLQVPCHECHSTRCTESTTSPKDLIVFPRIIHNKDLMISSLLWFYRLFISFCLLLSKLILVHFNFAEIFQLNHKLHTILT